MQNLYEAILGEKKRIYYLTKFELFDQQPPGLKASWNWPAFLCGGVWALYRKMYGWFFAFWGVAILSNIFEKAGSPGIGALVFLAPWIAFTIYANSLYHSSVKKKIAVAQFTVKDESKLLEYLRYKGGVHAWVIWFFGLIPLIGILAAIAIPAYHNYKIKSVTTVNPEISTPATSENLRGPKFIDLGTFTVELLPEKDGMSQYLQVAITLKVDEPKLEQTITAMRPEILHKVNMLLQSKRPSELSTFSGKENLANDLKIHIGNVLGISGLSAVFFTSFVIQ